jgi:hypothetical protein
MPCDVPATPCKVSKAQHAVAAAAWRARQRTLNCGMTCHAAKVALALYVLSGHDSSIVANFICKKLRSPADHDPSEFVAWVETRYLDSPLDILLTFEIPETDVEKRINLEASKFVAAFRTAAYILNVPIRMLGLHLVVVRSRKSIFDSVMLLGLSR